MAKSQYVWHPPKESHRLGFITSIRDYADRVANSAPARLTVTVFFLLTVLFTALLSLPLAAVDGKATPLHDALFTAVSAVSVTGLTTVSTAAHWTFFGQLVILLGIFVGGLGILTLASLMAVMVSKRLGVRGRLISQEAMNSSRLGEVGALLRLVVVTSVAIELALALLLAPRFLILGQSFPNAAWHALFYAVSAFNNAGFSPEPGGAVRYAGDLWVLTPLMIGGFIGSLGFPVLVMVRASGLRFRRWNLHTKLTVQVSLFLVLAGALLWGAMEWTNPATIGNLADRDKVVHAVFASIMSRSVGFNVVDMNQMHSSTMLLTDALMFAGGGSASTAGGIKVTTLAVMFLAIIAEARGDNDVKAYGRTVPQGTLRVAISVVVLSATLVLLATGTILAISGQSLDRVLFEVISAFATAGLTDGLSSELPRAGVYVMSLLMFAGRIGSITLASALALRQRRQLFHYPEERPIIG